MKKGFTIVELLLSIALLALMLTAFGGAYYLGQESVVLSGNRMRAVYLAEEAIEVVRNIRDGDFANLSDGTHGLTTSGGNWIFSGNSDTNGIYTRKVTISTAGTNLKEVVADVTWQQNLQRTGNVVLSTKLSNWQATASGGGGGATSCSEYCTGNGYTTGICRQNSGRCSQNGETYEAGGDLLCIAGPAADTCCCQ